MIGVVRVGVAVVIVVVERNVRVVALDEATTGCVIPRCRKCQAGVFGQGINSLHQTLSECDFADNQAAIVILNRSGHDLSSRSRAFVHQHNHWIFASTIAVSRRVALLG